MSLSQSSRRSWTSILLCALILAPAVISSPVPFPTSRSIQLLEKRCDSPCGWEGRLCCTSGQYCFTDSAGQAQCGNGSPPDNGYWKTWTSVWTETNLATRTAVYSSYVPTAVAPMPTSGQCRFELNESQCGPTCCASNQYCFKSGDCRQAGDSTTTGIATATITSPTSPDPTGSDYTSTATVSPTTTVPFIPPVQTGTNPDGTPIEDNGGKKGGLSGGAIAGIVIGVLVGLALLGLLCFFCIVRGLLGAIAGLFGRKRHSDHSSSSSSSSSSHGDGGGGVGGPSKPDTSGAKKTLFAGLLAGLLVFLAKRKRDKHNEKPSVVATTTTTTSYTDYSSISGTTPSSVSTSDYMSRPGGGRHTSRYTQRPADSVGPSYPPRAYRHERTRPASYRSYESRRSRHSDYLDRTPRSQHRERYSP